MEKVFRRLLGTAVAGTIAGAMLTAPAAYADQDQPPDRAVRVCVQALSGGLSGSLRYIVYGVTESGAVIKHFPVVEVGKCSAAVPAVADETFVYQFGKQGAVARQISAAPPERLIEADTLRQYAEVVPGSLSDPTVVTFDVVRADIPPPPPPPMEDR